MKYIDHHAHMVSRTTDDYAADGADAAAWRSPSRRSGPAGIAARADGFEDYFRQLTDFEPTRAAQYRIQHYAWLGMNPKESDNRELSRAGAASGSRNSWITRPCWASARSA